jgi:aminopeptidase N
MRWWDDLWLNESFATYASVLAQTSATRWRSAWTTFCNAEKTWAYRQDQLPSTHPIVADAGDMEAVKTNFDGITYAKGASVLKQLVAWVGQEEFLAGLRSYFRRFEYGNTSLRDLLDELEVSSGRTLGPWAKEWLETTGVNTLRPSFSVDESGNFTSFAVLQEPATVPDGVSQNLRSHRVAIGLYDRSGNGASLVRRDRVELDVTGAETEVPKLVGVKKPDLVLLNDDDLTYAKIRLDDASMRTLVDHIGTLNEPLARALSWYAAWDMTRDAEMCAGDFLDLVIAGISQESGVQTVQTLLMRARAAADPYGDPTRIIERNTQLADACEALMRFAPAGDDIQLAAARALATIAASDEHLALITGLLDGSETVEGLVVDAELRWTLLHRLVVLGSAGEDDITNELDRDDTATGRRHARRLRASIPTAEAKAEAWLLATEDESLSNAEQNAVIAGFQQPEHRDLLRPYVERYFEVVGAAWERRTAEMAEHIAVGLYPHQIVEQSVVDATSAYLKSQQPPPALRRLIVENRDQMSRALRTQAFDSAR